MKPQDYNLAIEYILSKKLVISPYILINLSFYKENDPNFEFYYSKDNDDFLAFISVYYNNIQLWTSDAADYNELISFIKTNKFKTVSAQINVLEKLKLNITNRGGIYCLDQYANDCNGNITIFKKPTDPDYYKIAVLMSMFSDIGSDPKERSKRYKERNLSGMSRNYYCTNSDGEIIAHAGTHGESEYCAIIGGVVVHPDYRRNHIATNLVQSLSHDLTYEKKTVYLVAFNEKAVDMYKKIGFIHYCSWGNATL